MRDGFGLTADHDGIRKMKQFPPLLIAPSDSVLVSRSRQSSPKLKPLDALEIPVEENVNKTTARFLTNISVD